MGTEGWLKGCCCDGMGTEAEPRSGCSGDTCQVQGGCPLWGSALGLALQSPALLSVGIQRAPQPWESPLSGAGATPAASWSTAGPTEWYQRWGHMPTADHGAVPVPCNWGHSKVLA